MKIVVYTLQNKSNYNLGFINALFAKDKPFFAGQKTEVFSTI